MEIIKKKWLEELLELSNKSDYPKTQVIEEYMNGNRKAQENTVRGFAHLLKVDDWNELVIRKQ